MNGTFTCVFNGAPSISDCVPAESSGGIVGQIVLAACCIAGFLFLLMLIKSSMRIIYAYEKGVVFRFGKLAAVRSGGLTFLIPWVDTLTSVNMRVQVNEIKQQEMITKDSISLVVSAVVFFRVIDPRAAIIDVYGYATAIDQFSLTSLRNVVGSSTLDEVLGQRDKVANSARAMLDEVTEKWGVEAQRVEIKQLELPDSMKRAMAREAEAIREKRARIIKSEAEQQAADNLSAAALTLAASPGALELRRLQTLAEIGAEHNSTIIAMLPQELLVAAKALAGGEAP